MRDGFRKMDEAEAELTVNVGNPSLTRMVDIHGGFMQGGLEMKSTQKILQNG